MADIDDFEDDDENFDTKPDAKSKLIRTGAKKENDDFSETTEDDELEDLEVEIADDEPAPSQRLNNRESRPKVRSEEDRLGRGRNRDRKPKFNESRLVRDLETKLNNERQRGDSLEEKLDSVVTNLGQINNSNIDSQIFEASRYLETAKSRHSQAVKDGDGDAAAEALDVMLDAKETLALLNNSKRQNTERKTQPNERQQNNTSRELPKPDPKVLSMFDNWHDKNDWYDPALRDKYSRIAFHIDNALNAEGYDPRTSEYWDEFDARCRENPTLAKEIFNGEDDNERETKMTKFPTRESAPTRRSSPVNERSTSTTAKRKIVVSRDRAHAMKEMGLQPGTAEWKKMAKKYESWDKQQTRA